jgi:hypothetical protein
LEKLEEFIRLGHDNYSGFARGEVKAECSRINHRGHKEHRGGIICSESARIDSSDPLLSEPTPVNLLHPVHLFKKPFSGLW